MSYVGTKTSTGWAAIRAGYQDTVDFIHGHNPKNKFFLTGVIVKTLVAEYVLGRARKRPLRQELLGKFESALRNRAMTYMGGFSTIHLDVNGELIDIQGVYELMHAVINTGAGVEMNIHFGMPCGLINDFGITRVSKTPAVVVPERIEAPKEPEYKAPYSCKALALVMGYKGGLLKKQLIDRKGKYTERQATDWCEKNDSPLLKECMDNATLAKKSKYLTNSEWSALRYILSGIDVDDARAFFGILFSYMRNSIALGDTHPITMLVNKFTTLTERSSLERMALVVMAWNAYRDKTPLVKLDWDMNEEEFPKAK